MSYGNPSIQEVMDLQSRFNMLGHHLVWVGPQGFVLAHTGSERESGDTLGNCDVHLALSQLSGKPVRNDGYYSVHLADNGRLRFGSPTPVGVEHGE